MKGREEILKVHAKKVKLSPKVDFNIIARMASGASGAELANIVNEAALRAVRDDRNTVTQAEIDRQVVELVKKQHEKALQILTENKPMLDTLARYLYENETITGEEFMKILESE